MGSKWFDTPAIGIPLTCLSVLGAYYWNPDYKTVKERLKRHHEQERTKAQGNWDHKELHVDRNVLFHGTRLHVEFEFATNTFQLAKLTVVMKLNHSQFPYRWKREHFRVTSTVMPTISFSSLEEALTYILD